MSSRCLNDQLQRLSSEQRDVVNAIGKGENVCCLAVAGSGKTTTSIAAAVSYLDNNANRHVYVITYNALLKEETRARVKALGVQYASSGGARYASSIVVDSYHASASRFFKTHSIASSLSDAQKQTASTRPIPNIGLIIVDEAQDLSPDLYGYLAHFLATLRSQQEARAAQSGAHPPFYSLPQMLILGDPFQRIYGSMRGASVEYMYRNDVWFVGPGLVKQSPFSFLRLSICYRISHEMAGWICEKLNPNALEHAYPDWWASHGNLVREWWGSIGIRANPARGAEPDSLEFVEASHKRFDHVSAAVENLMRSYGTADMAVLSYQVRNLMASSPASLILLNASESDWFLDTTDNDSVDSRDQVKQNKYLVTSIHKFKGAERDAIVVISVDEFREKRFMKDPLELFNLFYVACTRARKKLVVVQWGDAYATLRSPDESIALAARRRDDAPPLNQPMHVTGLLEYVSYDPVLSPVPDGRCGEEEGGLHALEKALLVSVPPCSAVTTVVPGRSEGTFEDVAAIIGVAMELRFSQEDVGVIDMPELILASPDGTETALRRRLGEDFVNAYGQCRAEGRRRASCRLWTWPRLCQVAVFMSVVHANHFHSARQILNFDSWVDSDLLETVFQQFVAMLYEVIVCRTLAGSAGGSALAASQAAIAMSNQQQLFTQCMPPSSPGARGGGGNSHVPSPSGKGVNGGVHSNTSHCSPLLAGFSSGASSPTFAQAAPGFGALGSSVVCSGCHSVSFDDKMRELTGSSRSCAPSSQLSAPACRSPTAAVPPPPPSSSPILSPTSALRGKTRQKGALFVQCQLIQRLPYRWFEQKAVQGLLDFVHFLFEEGTEGGPAAGPAAAAESSGETSGAAAAAACAGNTVDVGPYPRTVKKEGEEWRPRPIICDSPPTRSPAKGQQRSTYSFGRGREEAICVEDESSCSSFASSVVRCQSPPPTSSTVQPVTGGQGGAKPAISFADDSSSTTLPSGAPPPPPPPSSAAARAGPLPAGPQQRPDCSTRPLPVVAEATIIELKMTSSAREEHSQQAALYAALFLAAFMGYGPGDALLRDPSDPHVFLENSARNRNQRAARARGVVLGRGRPQNGGQQRSEEAEAAAAEAEAREEAAEEAEELARHQHLPSSSSSALNVIASGSRFRAVRRLRVVVVYPRLGLCHTVGLRLSPFEYLFRMVSRKALRRFSLEALTATEEAWGTMVRAAAGNDEDSPPSPEGEGEEAPAEGISSSNPAVAAATAGAKSDGAAPPCSEGSAADVCDNAADATSDNSVVAATVSAAAAVAATSGANAETEGPAKGPTTAAAAAANANAIIVRGARPRGALAVETAVLSASSALEVTEAKAAAEAAAAEAEAESGGGRKRPREEGGGGSPRMGTAAGHHSPSSRGGEFGNEPCSQCDHVSRRPPRHDTGSGRMPPLPPSPSAAGGPASPSSSRHHHHYHYHHHHHHHNQNQFTNTANTRSHGQHPVGAVPMPMFDASVQVGPSLETPPRPTRPRWGGGGGGSGGGGGYENGGHSAAGSPSSVVYTAGVGTPQQAASSGCASVSTPSAAASTVGSAVTSAAASPHGGGRVGYSPAGRRSAFPIG